MVHSDNLDKLKVLKEIYRQKPRKVNSNDHSISEAISSRIDTQITTLSSTELLNDEMHFQTIAIIDEATSNLSAQELVYLNSDWDKALPDALFIRNLPFCSPKGNGGFEVTPLQTFSVRGDNYFEDSCKILSEPPLFQLRGMQILASSSFQKDIALQPWSAFPKHSNQSNEWLILNFTVPGKTLVNVIHYFTATAEALEIINSLKSTKKESETSSEIDDKVDGDLKISPETNRLVGWKKSLTKFWIAALSQEKEYMDDRFKLIPSFVQAPYLVKAAVGNKPALIGTKIKQQYIRGPNYLEICIDIASSSVAAGVLHVVRGYSQKVIIDVGITIEASEEDELPERMLCQSRFECVNFDAVQTLSI